MGTLAARTMISQMSRKASTSPRGSDAGLNQRMKVQEARLRGPGTSASARFGCEARVNVAKSGIAEQTAEVGYVNASLQ